jgi:hypothetical protein
VQPWVLLKIVTVSAGARSFVVTKRPVHSVSEVNSGLCLPSLYAFLIYTGLIILILETRKLVIMLALYLGPCVLLGAVLHLASAMVPHLMTENMLNSLYSISNFHFQPVLR